KADAARAAPAEWVPLTVKCTFDTEDGPPAAGVKLQLQGASENTKGIPAIDATTGADGNAEFGKVLYGKYHLIVETPNGLRRSESVSVIPGRPAFATVDCPTVDGFSPVAPA